MLMYTDDTILVTLTLIAAIGINAQPHMAGEYGSRTGIGRVRTALNIRKATAPSDVVGHVGDLNPMSRRL